MESKIRDEEWILSLILFLIGGMNYVTLKNLMGTKWQPEKEKCDLKGENRSAGMTGKCTFQNRL